MNPEKTPELTVQTLMALRKETDAVRVITRTAQAERNGAGGPHSHEARGEGICSRRRRSRRRDLAAALDATEKFWAEALPRYSATAKQSPKYVLLN
jgi:hypothetical protein